MERPSVGCNCDPQYKFIESLVRGILLQRIQSLELKLIKSLLTSKWVHQSVVINSSESLTESDTEINKKKNNNHEDDLSLKSKVFEILCVYIERCVRSYTSNFLRPGQTAEHHNITCNVTWQQLTLFSQLWDDVIQEKDFEKKIFPQIQPSNLNYPCDLDVLKNNSELKVESLDVPKEKYGLFKIYLNPTSVASHTITWILNTYPRKSFNFQSCRVENYKISIGATEINEPKNIIPLRQHRKFLVAKFIARALGKSGYCVDQQEYFELPTQSDYQHSIFIVGEDDQRENQSAICINVGNVAVKESNSNGSKEIPDSTVEYYHNLRMQHVKFLNEDEGEKNEKDLAWIISASNLTTAAMNYDLLAKESKSNIQLVVDCGEQVENSGMFLIMYNYARVVSILRKFQLMVQKQEYPPLPPLNNIDFSLISSKEEMDLISVLWEWPRTLEKTVNFLDLEINISGNVRCIKEFAIRFNSFYTITKVLMPINSPHSFNKMFARIYFLQACQRIYEEFMEILQVEFHSDVSME